MSLDDDNHSSDHRKMKTRRSMDIEFHDHLDDYLLDELEELEDESSHQNRISRRFDDLDNDSFGEASDSCEPDHEYMEQVLEECHPERLNLLEKSVPEEVYKKTARRAPPPLTRTLKKATLQQEDDVPLKRLSKKTTLLYADEDSDSGTPASQSRQDETPNTSGKPSSANNVTDSINESDSQFAQHSAHGASAQSKTRNAPISNTMEVSESNTEEANEDAFTKSPQENKLRLDLDRPKLLGNMGKSTKKSLRTINGTFWSKPFKGLARSMRRNESAQGVTDS